MTAAHVALVGMMGAGKTTIGSLLARRLGVSFVDADHVFEDHTGRSIAQFLADRGEPHFRIVERSVLADLLAHDQPMVLGTGGGAVLDPANRALLADRATVVWLTAPPEALHRRVGADPSRPLLAGADPLGRLTELATVREPAYREVATLTLDTEHCTPEQLTEQLAQQLAALGHPDPVEPETLWVELGERSYPIVVGPAATNHLSRLLPAGVRRVAVVTQAGVGVDVSPVLSSAESPVEHRTFVLDDGEPAKSLASVERLCREWAAWGLTRADAVVAVGGGVVTDVAGFAASVYHRGVAVLHVSTTLLGQIDAAIGGKTGVNLPEGKNLLGAFWQPAGVICDTYHLATLPPREYRSGMGELAKYHFLGGEDLDLLPLPHRVVASAAIKAEVVSGDEREGGRRAILNYGHTLAHALESSGGYDLRHGEAVAIGLIYAAELAHGLGRIDAGRVLTHRRVVAGYDLPSRLPRGADTDELVAFMGRDKKATTGLTFVLDGPNGVEPVVGVGRQELDRAFAAVGWDD